MSRRSPKKSIAVSYRVFSVAKTGEVSSQDCFYPSNGFSQKRINRSFRVAIMDGVSQSFSPETWCSELVSLIRKHGDKFWKYIPAAADNWMHDESHKIQTTCPTERIRGLYMRKMLESGGSTTLTYLQINPSGRYLVHAVGDSPFLLIRNKKAAVQCPHLQQNEFTNCPDQISTIQPHFNPDAVHITTGTLKRGDTILLLTDCLCAHALKNSYNIAQLLSCRSQDEFTAILSRKASHILDDDLTMLRIDVY